MCGFHVTLPWPHSFDLSSRCLLRILSKALVHDPCRSFAPIGAENEKSSSTLTPMEEGQSAKEEGQHGERAPPPVISCIRMGPIVPRDSSISLSHSLTHILPLYPMIRIALDSPCLDIEKVPSLEVKMMCLNASAIVA